MILCSNPECQTTAGCQCNPGARLAAEEQQIMQKALRSSVNVKRKFKLNDRVRKIKGSSWQGRVRGFYSTSLTLDGIAVESERELGNVQIYPAVAFELMQPAERQLTYWGTPIADLSDNEIRRALRQLPDGASPELVDIRVALEAEAARRADKPTDNAS